MASCDILLFTTPFTQLNTPYPSTVYLTPFLRGQGFSVEQADPSIEVFTHLFSKRGLERLFQKLGGATGGRPKHPESVKRFLKNYDRYQATVNEVVSFLQGKHPTLALRIVSRNWLPEGARFSSAGDEELAWGFGPMGLQDRARHLASLYIDDLADAWREGDDAGFELSRYKERLVASNPDFDDLEKALKTSPNKRTVVDQVVSEWILGALKKYKPKIVGMSVPFPGNVFSAFRMAQIIKETAPEVVTVLGGGYVNTELRELSDPRIFEYFDYLPLDDGERPFLTIAERVLRKKNGLFRTFILDQGVVKLEGPTASHDFSQKELPTPSYDGLPLSEYVSLLEMLNPMHRLWSDGRWNKLTLAHGCYWKKCSFCDVNLDYIGRYDPSPVNALVDRIEAIIKETGERGFHFVDEAAPPALLKALAQTLIARNVVITWWGNVRFEKAFTPEVCQLLAASGCVAISGGLEVASDRLLTLMNKGVTVEQVARVTRGFADAGVMVHAYLMYGFPTQTAQETVDALERVRQLFLEGCLQSAFWHRFAATVHSPVGRNPEKFGIVLKEKLPRKKRFARNDVAFEDPTGCDHDLLGEGLRRALFNYMRGAGLDLDVRDWFQGIKVARTKVSPSLIFDAIEDVGSDTAAKRRQV